jgi:hypothetical protein
VAGFQNESGACEAFGAGSYKSFVGNNSCVACPANADTLGAGADSLEQCLCVPGYVASADCDEACAPCPRNTFTTQHGTSTCLSCPVNSGTDGPASVFADCKCEAGYTPGAYGETFCTACAAERKQHVSAEHGHADRLAEPSRRRDQDFLSYVVPTVYAQHLLVFWWSRANWPGGSSFQKLRVQAFKKSSWKRR